MRVDIFLALYNTLAISIAAYSLPLTEQTYSIRKLDAAQADFLRKSLHLPQNIPDYAVLAEVGLISFEHKATKAYLLLIHRISNNKLDPLTSQMLTWVPNPGSHSVLSRVRLKLLSLGILIPVTNFLKLNYQSASQILSERIFTKQEKEWETRALLAGGNEKFAFEAKKIWGIGASMGKKTMGVLSTVSRFRFHTIKLPIKCNSTLCDFCGEITQSQDHLIWECAEFSDDRSKAFADINSSNPHMVNRILDIKDLRNRSKFILGAGAASTHQSFWSNTTRAVAFFLRKIDAVCNQ
jgi:hypothetical protein